jgi:hypothetical protein
MWFRHAIPATAFLAAALASGCGVTEKLAVQSLIPIMDASVAAAYRDRDVETVREGIAGNLLLLRGVCEENPGNRELCALAAQTYFSYAMGFVEDTDPERAELLYAEGWRLGREGLERFGWFRDAESEQPIPSEKTLARIGKNDVELLFWSLANRIRWISLNLGEPEAVAQLPRVDLYLRRVLEIAPDYFLGMPHVMLGALQGFRPRLLGGDPEESRQQFEEAFRVSGNRMLIFQVLYAQFYCRQMLDEECFTKALEGVMAAPDDLLPDYRLWNEIARAKAGALLEQRDELF